MKSTPETRSPKLSSRLAFTLIELLVVIAVIAILAGLLFTALPAMHRARIMGVARAELTQIATAIEAYKAKYNVYPPDSPANIAPRNPLYFELSGIVITNNGDLYQTLSGNYRISANTVKSALQIPGLLNASATPEGTDDRPAIESFLKNLKPAQLATNAGVRVLACSADDDLIWRYNSSSPTNNPGSYDLWVDVVLGGRTTRVGNWNVK